MLKDFKDTRELEEKYSGTTQRPRLCVFRSSNNIYAQIIDDANRVTLVAASSLDADVKGAVNHTVETKKQLKWSEKW